jgi:glutamate synthase domain-containing protein 2
VLPKQSRCILISGFDGGTGAAPLTSLQHTRYSMELGLQKPTNLDIK